VVVIVAAADVDGVIRAEVRARAVDVGDRGPVQADRGGEILPGEAEALGAVAGMPEVGMAVEVDQPVPAARGEREPGRDEQAAVTPEHQRRTARVELPADPGGQPPGVVDQGLLVAGPRHSRSRVVEVTAGQHDPGLGAAAGGQPRVQPGLAQCLGRFRGPGYRAGLRRAQAEVRRRADQAQHGRESRGSAGSSATARHEDRRRRARTGRSCQQGRPGMIELKFERWEMV
jgi:hypothetical protein